MRPHGKTKLGFFPLPVPEANRLRNCLLGESDFSALDPCVGDGVAFVQLVQGMQARRYGVEIDAYRTEQARKSGNRNRAGQRLRRAQSGGSFFSALSQSSL